MKEKYKKITFFNKFSAFWLEISNFYYYFCSGILKTFSQHDESQDND